MFAGIDNKARKAVRGYVGPEGVARLAKKLYMGVDGKARLCWEAGGGSGGGESSGVRAYLYNGVKLPQLPDKGMPYALMELDKNEKYHVWLCNAPIHTSNIGVLLVPSGSAGYHYIVSDDGAAWELHEEWGMADSTYDSPFAWPNNAVWADYDVLEKDGITVRLAASNPVPLYSYNGVELPEFPDWDLAKYPYMTIHRFDNYSIGENFWHYWATSQPWVYTEISGITGTDVFSPAVGLTCNFDGKQFSTVTQWDQPDRYIPIGVRNDDTTLIWSSHTIIDEINGGIYFEASDPQPVYM